ncbi:hypothetical protein D3C73_1206970 [compost metagenome]
MPRIGLFNARQPQLHGVPTQALQVQNMAVPLLDQIVGGEFANQLMVGRHAIEPHLPVAAVNQHAGFIQICG